MRYKLMTQIPGKESEESEFGGQRKKTRAQVDKWIVDNERALGGIEWRAGYTMKFKLCPAIYTWRKIKDGEIMKY